MMFLQEKIITYKLAFVKKIISSLELLLNYERLWMIAKNYYYYHYYYYYYFRVGKNLINWQWFYPNVNHRGSQLTININ